MIPLLLASVAAAPPYPPLPATTADADQLGRGVQRTMSLLAASTAEKPSRVRILFYGQSITEQDWWKAIVADLKTRFPTAVVDAQNRAIGGFSSQRLVNTAEHDLYPFDPDLLIFHVYGAHDKYEEIIRSVRTRTAAEVLMQRDHLAKWPPAEIDEKKDKGAWWDHFMNERHLPTVAKKYGCGLVDVRGRWADYLRANKLEPKALLKDDIHLNDHGNFVMAAIVSRYLVHRPELKEDQGLVKELVVGKDVTWEGDTLTVPFTGYRTDVVCDASKARPAAPAVSVRIDGQKPSARPETRWITRPAPHPWSKLFLMQVGHTADLVEEDWTLTVTKAEDGGKRWAFTVTGSKTGPDGGGVSDKPFVSKSGRVTIDAAHWFPNGGPPDGYRIAWSVKRTGADELPVDSTGTVYRDGRGNRSHVLTLTATDLRARSLVRSVQVRVAPFPKPDGAKP